MNGVPRLVPRRPDGRAWMVLPLQTWLLLTHLVVLLLPVAVVVGTGALGSDLRKQTRWDLEHQGALLAMVATDQVRHARALRGDASLQDVSDGLSQRLRATKAATLSGIRVTDAAGVVVATSGDVFGEDLSADALVAEALEGRPGVVVRPRPEPDALPLGSESRRARVRVFVAVPVVLDGELLGAVVLSRTPREELQALYHMAPDGLLVGAGVALSATLVLALAAAYVLSRSLGIVAGGADRIAVGVFEGLSDLAEPEDSHVAEVASVARSVTAMTARLRERLGYIAEFASNVSHEFKTPLATLRGTLELLEEDEAMPPEQRMRFLRNAVAELDRLEALVEGLLSLARAEEGANRHPLELQDVIEDVVERHPAVRLEGRAARVQGNPSQLAAALENLVRNAERHGGARVTVRGWRDGEHTGFEVEDDGPGISSANLPRVFDRFFTTDRGLGTGLGLALVRAVATGHGGEVSVRSEPGRTCFRIDLPLR